MSVNYTFDCNMCESKNIKSGVTVVYETDQSGNIGANISFYKCFKGLHIVDDRFPKVIHICANCHNKLVKPVEYKK
jgi:hypothetical protein